MFVKFNFCANKSRDKFHTLIILDSIMTFVFHKVV